MTDETSSNRRKTQRVEVLLKIEYREPTGLLSDYIMNLAEGGLFIHTNLSFSLGQMISFSLSFPGILEPIELQGIVRWRRALNPNHPENLPGIGVEFAFRSEAEKQEISRLVATFQEDMRRRAQAPSRTFRVLLVEDNKFILQLFEFAIRQFHDERIGGGTLEVITAMDGREALHKLKNSSLDLAIVDHFLPAMTGCELIKIMRQDQRVSNIPILMVSVGGEKVRKQAYESGADLYLDKPVLHKQLAETLSKLLTGTII